MRAPGGVQFGSAHPPCPRVGFADLLPALQGAVLHKGENVVDLLLSIAPVHEFPAGEVGVAAQDDPRRRPVPANVADQEAGVRERLPVRRRLRRMERSAHSRFGVGVADVERRVAVPAVLRAPASALLLPAGLAEGGADVQDDRLRRPLVGRPAVQVDQAAECAHGILPRGVVLKAGDGRLAGQAEALERVLSGRHPD